MAKRAWLWYDSGMAEIGLSTGLVATARMSQEQRLTQQMRQALEFLQKPDVELSASIRQLAQDNPAFELVDESPDVNERSTEETSTPDEDTYEGTGDDFADYLASGLENAAAYDPDAGRKHDFMLNSRTATETLQDHLMAQVELSGLPERDCELAHTLICYIRDSGMFWYDRSQKEFPGCIAEIRQATGATEDDIFRVLSVIRTFDPPGCGATTASECLLAQMDKLDDSPWEDEVRALIERHLPDLAAGRTKEICDDLGISAGELPKVVAELKRLDGAPGRAFAGGASLPGAEFIRPEVFVTKRDGRYVATVESRGVPQLRISQKFEDRLSDPSLTAEERAIVRSYIAKAREIIGALERRPETIRMIAQEICDAQSAYFDGGETVPLTMVSVASKVGVDESTVSRTVNKKYMSTPRGTFLMRRFFTTGGIRTESGVVGSTSVKDRIKAIVAAENPADPLSDQKIADALAGAGLNVARRTVAKYRDELKIPGAAARRIRS